jgi:hypothetical protein
MQHNYQAAATAQATWPRATVQPYSQPVQAAHPLAGKLTYFAMPATSQHSRQPTHGGPWRCIKLTHCSPSHVKGDISNTNMPPLQLVRSIPHTFHQPQAAASPRMAAYRDAPGALLLAGTLILSRQASHLPQVTRFPTPAQANTAGSPPMVA